ncbi:site-2 protease family protein [Candidatus Roizmanbacteria bacterium]|jgi:Zn-dependent protease|nr:site-2 protease family protein [Candidatus Roizmanbacteria bacterium]
MINYLFSNPLMFLAYTVALLVSLSVHEFCHAWVADYLGDPTARLAGRLKLNPLVHIDRLGLIFLLFFGFGWGKPVEFDPFNLKNPRKDAALISLAGPLSNFVLALLFSLLLKLLIFFKLKILYIIGIFFFLPLINLNIVWGLFNLIPIHPLDGFKVVGGILPEEKAREWYGLQRYGMLFLILMIFPLNKNGSMLDIIIRPLSAWILNLLIPGNLGGII